MDKQSQTPQTIIIDNFSGALTRILNGDMNSGMARYATTNGNNPVIKPQNLMFNDAPIRINGSIITDCIVAQKGRVESGIMYVYAVGNTGRVYKIQVNDPTTQNPNYDTAVLLTTITINSPTFNYSGSIEFYSGYIFIGHDIGATRINFDGSNETFVGTIGMSDWTPNVPRPMKLFIGSLYFGNGNNIAQLDSGLSITSYAQINPSFPTDYVVTDLDVTYDGVYLVMTLARLVVNQIFGTAPDSNQLGSVDTTIAYWNGTDTGATSFASIPSFAATAYKTFGGVEFSFGYDTFGAALLTPVQKSLTLPGEQSPLFGGVGSVGNAVIWAVPEYVNGQLYATIHAYGVLDAEIQPQPGHFRLLQVVGANGGDVLKIPSALIVSNLSFSGISATGYTGNVFGASKLYFSTFEFNGVVTASNFYSANLYSTGSGSSTGGVYETQTQLFGKKIVIKQVRIYLEPLTSSNQSFLVDLIGMDGNAIGSARIPVSLTSGTYSAGDTLAQGVPSMLPTPAVGVRITNTGTVTPIIHKIELDYVFAGK